MSKDIIGLKFNRLTVLELHHKVQKFKKNGSRGGYIEYYLCKCDCGKETIIEKWHITSGRTKSCGCIQKESTSNLFSTHHLSKHQLYNTWCKMKERCYKPICKAYPNYGGRGIKVCDEWKNNFQNFYDWALSNGYKEDLTLDRIDVNGNYEPLNCRWISQKQQCNNKRTNFYITIYNRTQTLKEWCEEKDLNYSAVQARISRGWTIEDAMTIPIISGY